MDGAAMSTHRTTRILVSSLATAAAIGAVFTIGAEFQVASGNERPNEPAQLISSSLPEGAKAMLHSHGVDVAESVGVTPAGVDVKSAASNARKEFALAADVGVSSATLVKMTTPGVGRELETDPSRPSRISPMYSDRRAWVVTFENAPHVKRGPMSASGETGSVAETGTLVVFLDADTGEFLYGMSY